jgi:DNA-binding GntR family transcriptional regulator
MPKLLAPFTPVDSREASVVTLVEAAVEDAIASLRLADGAPLIESELAAALGVSRSPVRDALKRLAHKGLVETRGRRGFAVATFSQDQISDFFSLREVLEGLAARLAAARMTDSEVADLRRYLEGIARDLAARRDQGYPADDQDFHALILRGARNTQLDAAMQPIQARVRLLRRRSGAASRRAREALTEHRAILDAIERRDADEAEALMRAHVRMARDNLRPPDRDGVPQQGVRQ